MKNNLLSNEEKTVLQKLQVMSIRRNNMIVIPNWLFATKKEDKIDPDVAHLIAEFEERLLNAGYVLSSQESQTELLIELFYTTRASVYTFMEIVTGALFRLTGNPGFDHLNKNYQIAITPSRKAMLKAKTLALMATNGDSLLVEAMKLTPSKNETIENTVQKDEQPYVTLSFVGEAKYKKTLLVNLLSSTVALSQSDQTDLDHLLSTMNAQDIKNSVEQSDIQIKETLTFVFVKIKNLIKEAASNNNQEKVAALKQIKLSDKIKTATDLLRVVYFMKNESTVLSDVYLDNKLTSSDRRFILDTLETLSNPIEDMLKYKSFWRAIGKLTHPTKKKHPKASLYFDYVFDKKQYTSFNATIDKLVSTYVNNPNEETMKTLLDEWAKRPSELIRNLDFIVRLAETDHHVRMMLSMLSLVGHTVPIRILIQARNHFLNRNDDAVPRMVYIGHNQVALEKEPPLEKDTVNQLIMMIDSIIKTQLTFKPSLGTVYIDRELMNIALPTSGKGVSAQGKNPRTSGSRQPILMRDKDVIRPFVLWKDADSSRVDIDLSVKMLDEDLKQLDHISFTNTHNDYATHSGDITGAPDGAAEYVDINIKNAKENDVRYVAMEIYSYSGQSFDDINHLKAGFMLLDADDHTDDVYNQKRIRQSIDISEEGLMKSVCLFDLEDEVMIWVDQQPRVNAHGAIKLENNECQSGLIYKKMINQQFTSLYDLFVMHTQTRATATSRSPKSADTVFMYPTSEHPLDIQDILSNWM